MKIIQPTLINFSVFKSLNLFSEDVCISESGIIHTKRVDCPFCGNLCNYNGSSNKGKHVLSRSVNSFFRKGQQYCAVCDKTVQVENVWLDDMIEMANQFVASQIISLSEQLSEDEIVSHLENTLRICIPKSTVHTVIGDSNTKFENLEFETNLPEGFYGYDEQFLKIDGKRAYRIVFYDLTNNKVIYEKIHYKFSKKILKEILLEVFCKVTPKGFVVDMRVEYPAAFKGVFGRKIKLQFCIFHLNKLILKEYRDSLKIGKKVKWTLMDYYNMYKLFNIFYNRSFELKRLKQLMQHLENFKHNLTTEKVAFYVDKYAVKYKKYERQKEEVIKIMKKKLIKSFRRILHNKRNLRKRRKTSLKTRTVESATKKFKEIKKEKTIFPKKIQKRINRIETNFCYFIASEGKILTNNKLEGFFGATLKKFRKKSRKSLTSFSALLKRKRAKQEGISIHRQFTIFDLAKLFTALTLFTK